MRMRNPKNKEEIINNCDFLITDTISFPNKNPLHIEIGMGKGNFLLKMALNNPDINFIGIEKYASVASIAIKKIKPYHLPNLKIIISDVAKLEELLKGKVSVIYLNFSDPWPKVRHEKRRLTSKNFLDLYHKLFKDKEVIIQKTDNDDLFEYSLNSFKENGYTIEKLSYDLHNEDIPNVMTEYEEKFSEKGIKIKYLKAVKSGKMKLKLIGTGNMWTSFNSASYLIDDHILIDIPNGSVKNLLRLNNNPLNIDELLITHFHGDHYFDMPFFLLYKSKRNNLNLNIYCSKDGIKKINILFKLAFPHSFKEALTTLNLKYNSKDSFKINDYFITKYLVSHGNIKPSYGYLFQNKDLYIGFTGDTSMCDNIDYLASKCHFLICDCSLIKGNKKHLGIDNINSLSNKYPSCKFIVSHLSDEAREELILNEYPNIIVPKDGDEFNLTI